MYFQLVLQPDLISHIILQLPDNILVLRGRLIRKRIVAITLLLCGRLSELFSQCVLPLSHLHQLVLQLFIVIIFHIQQDLDAVLDILDHIVWVDTLNQLSFLRVQISFTVVVNLTG